MNPVLLTPRLALRPHDSSDVDFMVRLNADPEVVRYTGDEGVTPAQARAIVAALQRQYAERRIGRFVTLDRFTGERLGWCGLRWWDEEGAVDLGYRFHRRHWGRGYATESSIACLAWGRHLGFRRVFAYAHPDNPASGRVLVKLGFRATGEIDEEGFARFHFGPWSER